ncbi:MAG: c-type cytochrome [Chlorobia bacterium]|nr:c-type cytochrome [Fimbriimonadaceae bacterium]
MARTICIAFAIIGLCIGCGPKEVEATSSTSSTAPSTAAGYADVQAVFTKSCVGCHGDTNPKAGISLTNHEALMKGTAVTAGDPANSLLIQALRGADGKKQMPMNAPPLTEDEIKKVEDWIKAGAKA